MDNNSYIPPAVRQAMDSNAQKFSPNLTRQFTGTSNPAYVPTSTQQSMARELQKTLPPHLQQYAEAYVSQTFSQPRVPTAASNRPGPMPPVPNVTRLDHSLGFGEQFNSNIGQMPPPTGQPNTTGTQAQNQPPAPPPQASSGGSYDFILGSSDKPKSKPGLPSFKASGPMKKVLIGVAAFFFLIIAVSVAGSSGSKSNSAQMLAVVQDQTEIIHLTSTAAQQPDISTNNQNFVATTNLVINSASTQLDAYLTKNDYKYSQTELNLRVSKTIDTNLSTAETAGTFNQTFTTVITSQLNTYMNDLSSAYNATKGDNGRSLLLSDYKQTKLLKAELAS